jgi:hypothetical protein
MRKRISPSIVVSIIALVLSTTGSAFAAKTLIDGSDIRDGSITSADIKDGSLRARDLASSSAPASVARAARETDGSRDGSQQAATKPAERKRSKAKAKRDRKRERRVAKHVVRTLVPFAPDETAVRSEQWRAYVGTMASPPKVDDDGIAFGPFATGDEWSSAYTYALKGARLADLAQLTYTAKYVGGGGPAAAPYLVLVTEAGHHVTFTPSKQSGDAPEDGAW